MGMSRNIFHSQKISRRSRVGCTTCVHTVDLRATRYRTRVGLMMNLMYVYYSYNQGATRPEGGALRAPVCVVIIRALRALMSGRRATRACAAVFRHDKIDLFVHFTRVAYMTTQCQLSYVLIYF